MPELPQQTSDGRRLRSERSRSAIVDAALDLIREGVLVPTAQQISDRAGVGLRTFFRHFEDMESLFTEADSVARTSYESVFALGPRKGELTERLEHVVRHNAQGYERLKNFALSSRAQLWRSKVLAKNYARNQSKLRANLLAWLPEIEALEPEQREAIDAIASFDMWHRLRTQQGLSKKKSIEVVIAVARGLLLSR